MEELTGRIINIQKCSIHDGRGMRTTVFFKGCGLHCLWCANPESIHFYPEVSLNTAKCMGCGFCAKMCKSGAVTLDEDGSLHYDRKKCTGCGACARMCPTEARKLFGEDYTVDELFKKIYQDRYYFQHSGGGVTFSGGEALMQPEFLLAVCKKCRQYRINVAIESCGCGDYEKFKPCLDYIDFIYFDLKQMDPEMHRKITGQTNERILANLEKISQHGIEICVRTPVVPGWNDSEENIRATAEFIKDLPNVKRYELLAYHKLGINKYKILDREYPLNDVEEPSTEHEEAEQKLYDYAEDVVIYRDIPEADEEKIRRIGDADALLVFYTSYIGKNVIESCPDLRYIGMCCSLYTPESANVDIPFANSRGIVVTGIRRYGDRGVAEFVSCEIVRLFHGFGGIFYKGEEMELAGTKVGVVGLGDVGSVVAELLLAFKMDVYYYSRTRKPEMESKGIKYLPFDELLQTVDVLTTHLHKNTPLMDCEDFKRFGNGKVLINTTFTAPYPLDVLREWLEEPGNYYIVDNSVSIGGTDGDIFNMPNVICPDMVAGQSMQSGVLLRIKVLENIRDYLSTH